MNYHTLELGCCAIIDVNYKMASGGEIRNASKKCYRIPDKYGIFIIYGKQYVFLTFYRIDKSSLQRSIYKYMKVNVVYRKFECR